jgi:glutaminyl-tRNA synthetase
MRRRGYTPESIRLFAEKVGVAKRDNVIDLSLLEWCVREDLNKRANRYMAVLHPLKVVVVNYPEGQTEEVEALNNPEDENAGKRRVLFSREIYIERDDFMENPPKKYFRLSPGNEVRLRYAYIIKCEEAVKDAAGNITELRCTYDPETRSGSGSSRQVKGTIHWVSAAHDCRAEVRLFDRLFTEARMDNIPEDKDYTDFINPDSLRTVTAFIEPALKSLPHLTRVQFERLGYFAVDADATPDKPIFNRTVTLKDTWAKIAGK